MTTTDPCNVDVAAYALGVLNAQDTETFEFHLVWCENCAAELQQLLPTTATLSLMHGTAYAQAERATGDARLFDEMLNVVALRRRRAFVTRTLAVAAGIMLIAVLVIVGGPLFARSGNGRPTPRAQPSATHSDGIVSAQDNPSSGTSQDQGPGIGGPDIPAGEQLSKTDQATGARMDMSVATLPWGTELTVSLSHVTGPLDCELYVVDRLGSSTAVASWRIDSKGYGTAAHPDPLLVTASTSILRTDMQRVFVRAQAANQPAKLLVTIPL